MNIALAFNADAFLGYGVSRQIRCMSHLHISFLLLYQVISVHMLVAYDSTLAAMLTLSLAKQHHQYFQNTPFSPPPHLKHKSLRQPRHPTPPSYGPTRCCGFGLQLDLETHPIRIH